MRVKRATEADFDKEKHQIKKWLQIQKLRKEKNKNEWKKVYGKKRIWMGEEGKTEIIEKGSWINLEDKKEKGFKNMESSKGSRMILRKTNW